MRYKVIITPTAQSDLLHLKTYIKANLTPKETIYQELQSIEKMIMGLTDFPERYPLISPDKSYRKLTHKKYLIIYTIQNQSVVVFYIRSWKTNIIQNLIHKMNI